MKEKIKRWLPLIMILCMMVVAYFMGLYDKISLQMLQENKEVLHQAVEDNPIITALQFMGIYTVFVALSLPAATLLTLAGGFLFGAVLGTVYVVISATVGATIVFLVARTSLGKTLREKAGGLYKKVEKNMNENATGYLLFMRLVPLFPFFLVNIVPALFNVRLHIYVLTTLIGIIPGSFVYVNLGQQLGDIDSLKDLVSYQTLLAFLLLGIFSLIPTCIKQFKRHKVSISALVFLTGFVFLSTTNAAFALTNREAFTAHFDDLLKAHVKVVKDVKSGVSYHGVDYSAWEKDPRYKHASHFLKSTDVTSFESQTHEKAFWINAYNFLTIDLIIKQQEQETIKNLGSFFMSPWTYYDWSVGNRRVTLDEIEHDILRPMGDAKIHFAINCASISCPDLRMEAYRPMQLDDQLKAQVISTFSNEGKGLRIEGEHLYVSKIFDWYKQDFYDGDIVKWISLYKHIDQPYEIHYLDYNWALNKAGSS